MHRLTAAACFLLLMPVPAPGQEAKADDPVIAPGSGQAIHRMLEGLAAQGRFRGSVVAARGGEVLLSAGYGVADRETGRPNTRLTRFDLASVSKQFTAAAILKLEGEGKLKTTDRISRHLGEMPEDKKDITIEQLMSHTSGFVDPRGVNPAHKEGFNRHDYFVKTVKTWPLGYAPGTEYRYTNLGYIVLAAVAEAAAGEPFDDYIRKKLFEPAGMSRTTLAWLPGIDPASVSVGQGGSAINPDVNWIGRGCSCVLSTADDLLAWTRAAHRGSAIFDEKARRKRITPVQGSYAYGLNVRKGPRGKVLSHSGSDPGRGFYAYYLYYPDADVFVAMLANVHVSLDAAAGDIAGMIFESSGQASTTVKSVEAGSAAEKAGLKAGDLILSYDGRPTPDRDAFLRIKASVKEGRDVDVLVRREGKDVRFRIRSGKLGLSLGG